MDRIISLLAALVGLIALGGAILVHVNGETQQSKLAAQIAELRSTMGGAVTSAGTVSSIAEAVPSADAPVSASASQLDPQAVEISHLKDQIAALELANRQQAAALAEAQTRLAAGGSSLQPLIAVPSSSVAAASEALIAAPAASGPASSSAASSKAASGASADCIPTGTRFIGQAGDSFAICKTNLVVKIAAIGDGVATIDGAGPIAVGSFGDLIGKGCSVMVFSADVTGFADLRVTCK